VRSNFTAKLPLTVKPSYELNGKSTTAAALAPTKHHLHKVYKSGSLKVTYEIDNVTHASTNVSFEGFNGAKVAQKITQPLPVIAEMKASFPSDASDINAPGASLAAGHNAVKATWTLGLAPPLTPASQTISYTVHLGKVIAPSATVEAEVVVPSSTPTGKVPEDSAAALTNAEAQVEQGLSGPPVSLGGTRSDLDGPQRSANTKVGSLQGTLKPSGGHKSGQSASSQSAPLANLQPSVAQLQENLSQLTTTQTSAQQSTDASATTQLGFFNNTASSVVTGMDEQVTASSTDSVAIDGAVAGMVSSISALNLLLATHLTHAGNHVTAANALSAAVAATTTLVGDLIGVVQQHATEASALDALVEELITDANAFPAATQSTPQWVKLAADLATAKAKADLVASLAASLAQKAAAINTAVQRAQTDAAALALDAQGLASEASNVVNNLAGHVATIELQLFSTAVNLSNGVAALTGTIATGRASIALAESNAQSAVANARTKASAGVANAKQVVQNSAQQVAAEVQAGLSKANSDYAQLLALVQIAQAHQLPGGNAMGANVQNGAYIYRIANTK
jgi:hypothetical protein